MRNYIKENKFILAGLCVVFIACFIVIGTRIGIESQNKTFDIVLDFEEIVAMAMQTEEDTAWWLEQFRDMGITKVAIMEENLKSLTENQEINLVARMMENITSTDATWRSRYPDAFINILETRGFTPFDIVVEIDDAYTAAFVTNAIRQRFPREVYEIVEMGDKAYILIRGTACITLYSTRHAFFNSRGGGFIPRTDIRSSIIQYISLGLWADNVRMIQDLDMQVIPRTMSYDGWNDTRFAQAVLDGYAALGVVPEYLIAGGQAVIGYDDGLDLIQDFIAEHNITVGLIENTTQLQNILQRGVVDLTVQNNFNSVRVFSVWDYIQNRYQIYGYEGAEEIGNTLFRAITERNIRVIYYKPIKYLRDLHTYVTNVETYREMFESLKERLARHGFTMGSASVMQEYRVPLIFKILFGIGAVLAGVLLVRSFIPMKEKHALILAGLGSLGVIASFRIMPNTSELIVALSVAIIFGCLATTFFTARGKYLADKLAQDTCVFKLIGYGILTLICVVIIALLGALLQAATLSSIGYLLELDIFRGVVVARVLPIGYFAIAYLAYFGYGANKTKPGQLEPKDLRDLLNIEIKVWMLVLAAAAGAVGAYYVIRTGHDTGVEVSAAEMLFRNMLEYRLLARPRTQEFMFAFPMLLLFIYSAVRRFRLWSIVFGGGAIIGATSVINTFAHLRTPLYLSFARTGYSILFGIIIGAVCVLAFDLIYKAYNKFVKNRIEASLNE